MGNGEKATKKDLLPWVTLSLTLPSKASCPQVLLGSGSGLDARQRRRRDSLRCSWARSSSERMGFHLRPPSPGLSRMGNRKSSRAFSPAAGRSKHLLKFLFVIVNCFFWESNLNFRQGHKLMSSLYK